MSLFFNLAHAAGSSVVSCTGSDCTLCSLLETVSNVYNFFLGVSCAVAALALIIAGVNYLLNGGDWSRLQKSKYILKSGLIGFGLVLLGWVVIQSVIKAVGFENAGGWWQFQCGLETSETSTAPFQNSRFPAYYEGLKTFPDLTSYIKSGEKTAKLTGPTDALAFASQINSLKDGETLHFLAPVRVDSAKGSENLYLPLLSVIKKGNQLKLRSTGEYWNLVQNSWPKTLEASNGGMNGDVASILNKLLGANSFTDDRALVNSSGDSINNTDLASLYNSIAGLLKGSGDRTESSSTTGTADLSKASLSELIALASSYNPGDNPTATDQLISTLTTQVLKMVSGVVVEKENTGADSSATAGWRCESSGGTWKDEKCACPDQQILGSDLMCHDAAALKEGCEKSGGAWKAGDSEGRQTLACGSDKSASDALPVPEWQLNAERAGSEGAADSGSGYCACPGDSCLDWQGLCLAGGGDQDGDKVPNNPDICPNTPNEDKNAVNKDKKSQYYGCACSEIGSLTQTCPPDQCVGQNWVDYPDSLQACKNGQPAAYSCQPTTRSYDQQCVDNGTGTGPGTTDPTNSNYNTNSSQWAQNPNNPNPFQNTSTGQSKASPASGLGNKPNASSLGKTSQNSGTGKPRSDSWSNDDRRMIPNNNNLGPAPGGPEAVKMTLKRIYEKDKLRYLMIFKYVASIGNMSPWPGTIMTGLTGSCGRFVISFSTPIKALDSGILHESTHSAEFCNGTIDKGATEGEFVAVANESGSVGGVKEAKGQKEEVKIVNLPQIGENKDNKDSASQNERVECRGYQARWLNKDIDPIGDMNETAIASHISYAKIYKQDSGGTWIYGYPKGGSSYILRLNDGEHNNLLKVLETMDKKKCMSRPPEDLPQLEEKDYSEELLNGCKEAPILKIGG